ncbi:hypothetical protein, partial [Romboutsia timonensis]|uniref:hypothetical protein n=1 Tax=Romboutsia timonensis TaxID=1776391 RepID=UPI002E780C56
LYYIIFNIYLKYSQSKINLIKNFIKTVTPNTDIDGGNRADKNTKVIDKLKLFFKKYIALFYKH